jgi:hypothetical protein
MSLLGKIGSALDPGAIVKDAVNTILPKEAEIVGDLAGMAIDIARDNPVGAAKNALEALRDLPQAAHAVKDLVGGLMGESTKSISGHGPGWRGTPSFEPAPPNRGPQVNVTVNGGQVSITINETAHRWPRLQAAIDSVWQGSAQGPAHSPWQGGATPASPAPVFAGATATCGAAPATASASSAPVSSAGGSINSVAQMNGLSDAAFMNAVREGKISPDVAKDPAAMLQIQERMNRITQMNQLMSQMLAAMHQMAMSTIQNIRA